MPSEVSRSTLRKRGQTGAGSNAAAPHVSATLAPESGERVNGPVAAAATATRSSSLFLVYASLAGICGALSAVVGKLAVAASLAPRVASAVVGYLSSHGMLPTLLALLSAVGIRGSGDPRELAETDSEEALAVARLTLCVEWLLRVVFFASNALFTGQMWRFFLKSLSLGPTPVSQIINTGTNFAVSAFLGLLFFQEEVNAMWAAGALLVVVGLALVVTDPEVAKVTG